MGLAMREWKQSICLQQYKLDATVHSGSSLSEGQARPGWSDSTSAFYSHSHHLIYYVGSIYVLIA